MTSPALSPHAEHDPKIYYGYIIVGCAFIIMMVAQGLFNAFGLFFNPLIEEFNWSHAVTSGAFSLSMVMRGLLGILMGGLTDRYGPRLVLTACGVCLGLGFFLMSQVTALWQFYLFYGILIGAGMSGIWVPLLSSIARWFDRRRSLMTSIVVAGVGLGGLIVPPLLSRLIEAVEWRSAYMIQAGILLVVVVIVARFFRPPPAGVLREPDVGNIPGREALQNRGLSLRQAFRTRQIWLVLPAFFCSGYTMFSLLVHLVPHAEELGVSAVDASTLLAVFNGISLVGILGLAGAFGDRLGPRMVFIIGFGLIFIGLIVLIFARELWALYLFAIPFGIAGGALGATESPLVARLFGLASHGVIFGIAGVGFTAGTAVGPLVTGYLFDVTGTYQVSFIVCAGFALLGMLMVSLLRPAAQTGNS